MSVVVQLRGGLGNQLFQYAAGYALSQRHETALVLDTALLPPSEMIRGGVRRWAEQVSAFDHEGTFADSTDGSTARKRIAQSVAGRERALGDSRLSGLLGRSVYAHEARDDLPAFAALPADSRINAYCNSSAFFAGYEGEVRRQVSTPREPGGWFLAQRERMLVERPLALHVRWGDYLNLAHVYGSITPDYYRRAIAHVTRASGDRPVWLFSDDPAGAAEYLSGTVDIAHVVNPVPESSALENLLLLSSGAGLVGANSSFSWWAAFLGDTSTGSTVFPRPLFAPTGPPEPKDWLRADWIQLGRA